MKKTEKEILERVNIYLTRIRGYDWGVNSLEEIAKIWDGKHPSPLIFIMERCRNIKLSTAQWGYLINNSDLTKTSSSGLNALSSALTTPHR